MKKILGILLGFMIWTILGIASAEELFCISSDGLAVLMDSDGNEIIPAGVFDDIFPVLPHRIFAVGSNIAGRMRYDLCDEQGILLTDISCEMFDESDGVILFRRNGLIGAMDEEGNILIPGDYTQLVTNGRGGYLALRSDPMDDEPDEILFINDMGEVTPSGIRTAVGLNEVSEGKMVFRSPDNEKYGYLDGNGKISIEPHLDYASAFSDGKAVASENGRFGVLSSTGDWLISPKYEYLEIDGEVILGMHGRQTCVVWDVNACSELFRIEGSGLHAALVNGRPVVSDSQGIYLYALDGTLLMQASLSATLSAGAADQLILSDGDWGTECVSVVRADGSVSARTDQHLVPLDQERYAFLKMNAVAYNSQTLGEIRYSVDYDGIFFGMMDSDGNEILPAEYKNILKVGEDRYLTVAEEGYRVVDENGSIVWSMLEPEGDEE